MASPSVSARILVRTNVDWSSMDERAFAGQSDPTRPIFFIEIAKRGDLPGCFRDAFGVDFFRYRAELRRIAQSNLEQVENARLSIGFDDFDAWFYDGRDEFVFPTDDDDLYHPALTRTLERVSDDTIIVMWDSVQAGWFEHEARPQCLRHVLPALCANNWGVRKSFLEKSFDRETCVTFLSDHEFAQRCMVRHLGISLDWMPDGPLKAFAPLASSGVVLLADCYSLNFFHVGSACFFGLLLEHGSPRELYGRYDPAAPLELGDYVRWAEPYMQELRSVVPRLRQESR